MTGNISWVLLAAALLSLLSGYLLTRLLGLALGWLPSGLRILGGLGLIANTILALSPWILSLGKRIDLFEPIYFVTFLFIVVFVLRPMQILLDPWARYYFTPNKPELFQAAILLGTAGLVWFLIGYKSGIGENIAKKLPASTGDWQHSRIVRITLLYTIIGFAGYALAVSQSGGMAIFIETARGRTLIREANNWSIAALLVLVQVVVTITGSYYFKTRRLGALFFILLPLILIAYFLLGSRSSVLVALLTLLVTWFYVRGPGFKQTMFFRLLVGLFVIGAILFVIFAGALRVNIQRGGDTTAILSPSTLLQDGVGALYLEEYSQFDWLVITLDVVPSFFPFQKGQTFLQFFTQFIPKALWPDKPLPIGFIINEVVGGPGTGTPSTIIGELYLNFHVPGVILGMFLFGLFFRVFYVYLQNNRGNPSVIVIYAFIFASIHQLFTRSFAPKLFGIVLFVLPALIALRYIERQRAQ